jgi:hypothetical protein
VGTEFSNTYVKLVFKMAECLKLNRIYAWVWPIFGIYAAQNGSPLPTFRVSISVPSSSFQQSRIIYLGLLDAWSWDRQVDPKRRHGTTIIHCVKLHKNADLVYISAEAFHHTLYTLTVTLRFNNQANTGACIRRDMLSVTLVRSQFKRSCIAGGEAGLFTGALYLL